MATAAEINEIIKLYVGYYNRAPDPIGLNFWINAFDNGFGLDEMAVDFSTQPETLENYPFFENPSPSVEDFGTFIDSVYANLFNRPPDEPGREFWSTAIESGTFSVGQAISLIIEGATTSPDQDVVANKVAVGLDFFNKTDALPSFVFDEDDIVEATAIQAGVTENPASIATAAARTDTYVDGLQAGPGSTINLTTNTDVPGGSGNGADTQGGSGNDTYQGIVEDGGNGTLSSGDSIAAGGGDDTLNVRLVSNSSDDLNSTITLNATDLENIVVTDQVVGTTDFRMDLDAATGHMQLTASGGNSSGSTSFANVNMGTQLRMVDVEGTLNVGFSGDRSTSSDDAFSLYVEDTGTDSDSANFFLTENDFSGSDEDFEIANIETGGSTGSFLNMSGLALSQINLTGSQMLHLSDSQDGFEELEVVDASGMTGGGLSLDAQGNTESAFSFTGSDFDDDLFLAKSFLNDESPLSLNGGDGSDTLTTNNFTNLQNGSVNAATSFEVLRSFEHTTTLEADDFNIDTFEFANQNQSNRLTIRGVEDDDLFVFESDYSRNGELIDFEAETAGTELTFELRATSEDDGQIELVATGNNNDKYAIDLTDGQISEVTIVSSGSNEDANLIRIIEGNNGNYYAIGNASGASNFNVTGAQALTIAAAEGVALGSSDDIRGFEDGVNLDGSAATGDLRIAGSGTADAIETGSGDDIIYGLGGDDVLTGNDGMDQFRFSDWNSTDRITDFTVGEDKIGLSHDRVDFDATNESQEGAVLNSDDYVENLSNVANLTSAEDDKLVELQLAASESQIEDTEASASNTYLLVFNSTSGNAELWYDVDWATTNGREHMATIDGIDSVEDLIGLSNTDFVEYLF